MSEQGCNFKSQLIAQLATEVVRKKLEVEVIVLLCAQGLLDLVDEEADPPSDACSRLCGVGLQTQSWAASGGSAEDER